MSARPALPDHLDILVDLIHPAHVNFYKGLIRSLVAEGHRVRVVCLDRPPVPRIAREELEGVPVTVIGKQGRSLVGMALRTGLWRWLRLAAHVARRRPDASLTVAGFQLDLLSRIFRFRSVSAYDDPGHAVNFRLSRRFAHRFVLPEALGETGPRIVTYRGLKEWAYLSPASFTPDPAVPAGLGVDPGEYVFVRDVATTSLNYRGQPDTIIGILHDLGLSEETVVLSLEDKAQRDRYRNWRIIEEPVDVHNLMHHARVVISSGDSMAREGAELGVNAVYCGTRDMPANQPLIDLGFLHHVTDLERLVAMVRSGELDTDATERDRRRSLLDEAWDDPAAVVRATLAELVAGAQGS